MSIYGLLDDYIPPVFQSAIVAAVLLVLAAVVVRRHMHSLADRGLMPDEGVTLRNLIEVLVDALAGLARDIIGPDYRRFLGLLSTMFIFILLSNFMGLIPALGGSTSFADTTWAWAVIAFLVYNFVGIQKWRIKYILHFCGPSFDIPVGGGRHIHFPVLFWFFVPLEIILHLARMLTLAVRLLANMTADHAVVAIWLAFVPLIVPSLFLGLGAMVSVVQAFVFTLLTMTYIGMALEEPH